MDARESERDGLSPAMARRDGVSLCRRAPDSGNEAKRGDSRMTSDVPEYVATSPSARATSASQVNRLAHRAARTARQAPPRPMRAASDLCCAPVSVSSLREHGFFAKVGVDDSTGESRKWPKGINTRRGRVPEEGEDKQTRTAYRR